MQAEMPFFDAPEDALKAAVQALGGAKQVASRIWPERTPDSAARLLLDCLNPGRQEKLELGQVLLILRLARDAGHHATMQWLAADVGYDAKPITRAEEADRLALIVEQSTKTLSSAIAALERLQRVRAAA